MEDLGIQKFTYRLVMLMNLILKVQHAQAIHSIRVSGIQLVDNKNIM